MDKHRLRHFQSAQENPLILKVTGFFQLLINKTAAAAEEEINNLQHFYLFTFYNFSTRLLMKMSF